MPNNPLVNDSLKYPKVTFIKASRINNVAILFNPSTSPLRSPKNETSSKPQPFVQRLLIKKVEREKSIKLVQEQDKTMVEKIQINEVIVQKKLYVE